LQACRLGYAGEIYPQDIRLEKLCRAPNLFYNQFAKKIFLSHAAITGAYYLLLHQKNLYSLLQKHIHEPDLFDDAILLNLEFESRNEK